MTIILFMCYYVLLFVPMRLLVVLLFLPCVTRLLGNDVIPQHHGLGPQTGSSVY